MNKDTNRIFYIFVGPIGSKIVRNAEGKKVLFDGEKHTELKIPKWSEQQNLHSCEKLSELPQNQPIAIVLGKSGLIALDFDNELFNKALELYGTEGNISKSVGKIGGHLLFKYKDNDLTEYISNINGKKLNKVDTLYGNTLLYYDTDANNTKETISRNDNIDFMPLVLQYFVIAHYAKSEQTIVNTNYGETQVEQFATKVGFYIEKIRFIAESNVTTPQDKDNFNIVLSHFLKIITPRRYKDIMDKNKKKQNLQYPIEYHPDYLPEEESAHMYILSLSGVLTLDSSVSQEAHKWIIEYLNQLFSKPLEDKRINSILTRDFQSPKYQFNAKWNKVGYTKYNRKQELLEIMTYVDKAQLNFLVYNHVTNNVTFLNASTIMDYINLECGIQMKKQDLLPLLQQIKIISRPDKPFGYIDGAFNFYQMSKEMDVFYNPAKYILSWSQQEQVLTYNQEHPRWPTTTLLALENACGEKLQMFLSFMKRKYLYREYSPLIFVFFGVPHSFKSAVVNGVFANLSYNRTRKMTYEAVLEKYNAWQVNTDIVLIDEVHYMNQNEQKKLIKTINEISGNDRITSVRKMYQDFSDQAYPNELTFFLATNEQIALSNEIRDRRLVIFKSQQRVADALKLDDMEIKRRIQQESLDFAYYLASYNVSILNDKDYQSNESWKDEVYTQFQEVAHDIEDQILYAIDYNRVDKLVELLLSIGLTIPRIKQSIEYSVKLKTYYFRLFNTNEQFASIPSIFAQCSILDLGKIRKKINTMSCCKVHQSDYKDGVRLSETRKTIAYLGKELPDNLAIDITEGDIEL